MPLQPSKSDLHYDQMLTDVSVAYLQSEAEFSAQEFFPPVKSRHSSGLYWVWDRGQWFKSDVKPRARATESAGTGLSRSQASFTTKEYALHVDIADADIDDQDDGTDVLAAGAKLVTRHMAIQAEILFNAAFLTTGIWQGFKNVSNAIVDYAPNTDGDGYWDSDSADPIAQIDKLKLQMHNKTGYWPNKLGITSDIFFALKNHPSVLDRIKYTQKGMVTIELLSSLLDLKIVQFATVVNTAAENLTDTLAPLQRNLFLLAYAAPEPSKEVPSAGYTFQWTGRFGAESMGTRVDKIPVPLKKAQRVEVESAYQYAQVCRDLGILGVSVLQNP